MVTEAVKPQWLWCKAVTLVAVGLVSLSLLIRLGYRTDKKVLTIPSLPEPDFNRTK